jgi:arylsulfatase A-like enzyme
LFFAQAIKWMDTKRTAKQPFFAYIPLNAAHGPHIVPEKYYQQYLDKPGVSEDAAKFLGMVENIDTNFGTLLGKLKEWGIEDNTLVIYFTGDNGGTAGMKIFNAGLHGGKGCAYQGGTRSGAFFRWPAGKIPAGAECDALSAHLDIFPTLAEITGATLSDDVKKQIEGRSLLLDHRRNAIRRREEAGRRPQPAATAQEPEGRVGGPHARASRRTLGAWQSRGIQVSVVCDPEFALHAGEQRGALRPQSRPR